MMLTVEDLGLFMVYVAALTARRNRKFSAITRDWEWQQDLSAVLSELHARGLAP